MPFLSVSYTNYRNLDSSTIDLSTKEVYFVGTNGQGKSNLLETLYMVSYGTSFRTRLDSEIVAQGKKEYSVRALFKDDSEKTTHISVFYENDKKRIEKNGKIIKDRKDIINSIPCVLFCHDDLDFAVGAPERRRWFIDQSLSLYDTVYIDVLRTYKKILKNRNMVLKNGQYDMLDVYDIQMVEIGLEMKKKRQEAIYSFNRLFSDLYEQVTGITNVQLSYDPSWKGNSISEALAALAEKRPMDIAMKTSLSGPHRDRIRFIKDKKSFVSCASTGQRRLLSLLLRTAQALFYTEKAGKLPVLLMDDVLLELDTEKRQKFTSLLPAYDQLFCTFLPGEPYNLYKKSTTKIYTIENGGWKE